MTDYLKKHRTFLLAVLLMSSVFIPLQAAETLCFTQRVTDASSFNIYTGRDDVNNPIIWTHQIPDGILNSVVRVGLYIEAFDVDYPANTEHDRVYFNGYDLGLLEGFDDTWITVEKTVPVAALRNGINELRVKVDELRTNWKVTIRASELRFYCTAPDPDFSLGLSGSAVSVSAGNGGSLSVSLTGLNQFSGPVELTVSGLPSQASGSFSVNPAIPNPTVVSTLQISTAADTPAGDYTVTVAGQNGLLRHEASFTLTVLGEPPLKPDYLLSVSPLKQKAKVGQAAQYEIAVTAINGFNNNIAVDIANVPEGCAAAFTSRMLKPGQSAMLTLKTSQGMVPGVYTPKIYTWSGELHHEEEIGLEVEAQSPDPDFILRADPPNQTLARGGETVYTITLEGFNNFSGTVSLGAEGLPAGVIGEFSAPGLDLSKPVRWSIRTNSQAEPGNYKLTVNGVSGSLRRSVSVLLGITCPGFTVKAEAHPAFGPAPLTASVTPVLSPAGLYPADQYHYSWDFGDGQTSSERIPTHTWAQPGRYTVKLLVSDPCGAAASASLLVEAEGFEGSFVAAFSPAETTPGRETELLLSVQNDTRTDFSNVIISLPLPDTLEYIGETAPAPSSRNGHILEWRLGMLYKKNKVDIRVKLAVRKDAFQGGSGVISASAFLRHDSLSAPMASNLAMLTIRGPKVSLEKRVDCETARSGDIIIYTITARNESDADLQDAIIRDEWPDGLEFLSQKGGLAFKREKGDLIWSGVLPARQTVYIQVQGRIAAEARAGMLIRNRASLEALIPGGSIFSNYAETRVEAQPVNEGAIQFIKRVEIPQADVGRVVRFSITLANRSSGALLHPVVEDLLPQGFTYVEGSTLLSVQAGPDPAGRRSLRWELPNIPPNGVLTLRYQTVIGADARRGRNENRAVLTASDNTGKIIRLESSAFINVSSGGFIFYSALEGTVYIDRDYNDFFSPGDTPLEGIEVVMSNGQKTTTDRTGLYRFENLFAGEYAVAVNRVALPEKLRSADTVSRIISLTDGLTADADLGIRFAAEDETPLLRIEGWVFFDKNRNGQYDPSGDPPVVEFKVRIDNIIQTTGQNGKFTVSRLVPGRHVIEIIYGPKIHRREIELPAGSHLLDIPLKFTGIQIVIRGEHQ